MWIKSLLKYKSQIFRAKNIKKLNWESYFKLWKFYKYNLKIPSRKAWLLKHKRIEIYPYNSGIADN